MVFPSLAGIAKKCFHLRREEDFLVISLGIGGGTTKRARHTRVVVENVHVLVRQQSNDRIASLTAKAINNMNAGWRAIGSVAANSIDRGNTNAAKKAPPAHGKPVQGSATVTQAV